MNPPERDYYKLIGAAPVSRQDEIKRAYRSASRKWHPDLNPGSREEAERRMRILVAAYEVLESPEQRKIYDNLPLFQIRTSKRAGQAKLGKGKKSMKTQGSILDRLMNFFSSASKTRAPQPSKANEHFLMGMSLAQSASFFDPALKEFKQAANFDPEFIEAHWNSGILSYRKGLFADAVVSFRKILELNPRDADAKKMIELLRDDF